MIGVIGVHVDWWMVLYQRCTQVGCSGHTTLTSVEAISPINLIAYHAMVFQLGIRFLSLEIGIPTALVVFLTDTAIIQGR